MPHHLPHHGAAGLTGGGHVLTGGGHLKKKLHGNGTHGAVIASHEIA